MVYERQILEFGGVGRIISEVNFLLSVHNGERVENEDVELENWSGLRDGWGVEELTTHSRRFKSFPSPDVDITAKFLDQQPTVEEYHTRPAERTCCPRRSLPGKGKQ